MNLVWYTEIESSHYRNGYSPEADERLPPPLIVDLDGDGTNEIVVATRDPAVKVSMCAALRRVFAWYLVYDGRC